MSPNISLITWCQSHHRLCPLPRESLLKGCRRPSPYLPSLEPISASLWKYLRGDSANKKWPTSRYEKFCDDIADSLNILLFRSLWIPKKQQSLQASNNPFVFIEGRISPRWPNFFEVGGSSGICILRHCANFSQTLRVNEQQRNRWSTGSSSLAHITQKLDPYQLLFIRLSHVRMISLMTSQRNALILGGTLAFHVTFAYGYRRPPSFNSK